MRLTIALLFAAQTAFAAEEPMVVAAQRTAADFSLEELANITVTTVSGRPQALAAAPGSIYVITNDDIRRSGAKNIVEALQLAPNLQVARTGTTSAAITSRGFNGTLANKLQVLIDGRSIYTPTFSGVFWEVHDVVLEDVDRIEVISGPGGVLWGVNAVNGVINILTKSAAQTQGWMLSAGIGEEGSFAAARYGGKTENGNYRLYAKTLRWDDQRNPAGASLRDGLDRIQAGFRSDWTWGRDSFTLQGDGYSSTGRQVPQASEFEGANLLGRWRRDFGDGESVRVQAYYDWSKRPQQDLATFDLDVAYAMRPRGAHRILFGGGARHARDEISNSAALAFFPAEKSLSSWNVYAQDEIALTQTLDATIGAKVDHNTYTGTEFLPSARLAWRPTNEQMAWAAWSRAVRIPSRFDKELFLPGAPPFLLAGGPTFQSEVAYVYELGYRAQPFTRLSWSATAFYHDLEKQRSITPGPAGAAVVSNDREGHTSGVEGWAAWRVTDYWRLEGGYTHQRTKLRVVPGGVDLQPANSIASDPSDWWKLRSSLDLGERWQFDVMARHYGWLFSRSVPSYLAVDARLAWKVSQNVELSVAVQNLFDDRHVEWSPGAEFRRNGFLRARLDL